MTKIEYVKDDKFCYWDTSIGQIEVPLVELMPQLEILTVELMYEILDSESTS